MDSLSIIPVTQLSICGLLDIWGSWTGLTTLHQPLLLPKTFIVSMEMGTRFEEEEELSWYQRYMTRAKGMPNKIIGSVENNYNFRNYILNPKMYRIVLFGGKSPTSLYLNFPQLYWDSIVSSLQFLFLFTKINLCLNGLFFGVVWGVVGKSLSICKWDQKSTVCLLKKWSRRSSSPLGEWKHRDMVYPPASADKAHPDHTHELFLQCKLTLSGRNWATANQAWLLGSSFQNMEQDHMWCSSWGSWLEAAQKSNSPVFEVGLMQQHLSWEWAEEDFSDGKAASVPIM